MLSAANSQAYERGRRIAARKSGVEGPVFLPWDRLGAQIAWLKELAPDLVAVVEAEIWPNLFFACRRLEVPAAIVSGRLEEKDVARYRLALPFFRRVLSCASWIGAQDAAQAERFRAIGAPTSLVTAAGNLKADVDDPGPAGERSSLHGLPEDGLLLLAASTHPPEEEVLLNAFLGLRREFRNLRLVVAPRHVRRIPAVEKLVKTCRLRGVRWSSMPDGGAWDVLLVDRVGALVSFYRRADLAFVGGSFADRGGHNLFEPASAGIGILTGPHTENFQGIAQRLESAGALYRVDELSLESSLRRILRDPVKRAAMGEAALAVSRETRGSSRLYAEKLLSFVSSDVSRVEL